MKEKEGKEYFVRTRGCGNSLHEEFVKADSPKEASEKVLKKHENSYALMVYADANSYHKNEEALLIWLSKKADIRRNGMECPELGCDGQTWMLTLNAVEGENCDKHCCKKCGKKFLLDTKTFQVSPVEN